MITGSLVELLYEPASIQRWNDHIRPSQGFTELDKQAQKMVFAYVLGKFEEDAGENVHWPKIIEAGLFELLHRIKLTDIKPPVFHRMMDEKGEEINEWVLRQYQGEDFLEKDLMERFREYLFSNEASLEKKIVNASHYLATKWEFQIVYRMNEGLYGLEKERIQIDSQIEEHAGLGGVQKGVFNQSIKDFMDLVSQLRFHTRWGQTPRIPQTSVLGHSLVVATLSYFGSLKMGACPKRAYNNYFCGLFHDLPEVLTRDIVAPIKRAVEGLDHIIKEIESEEVREKLYPLLPKPWRQEMQYFIENEFQDRTVVDGNRKNVSDISLYNEDGYSPLDGAFLKACDQIAAFAEASLSIRHGIKSKHLIDAVSAIQKEYENKTMPGVDVGRIFKYFI